MVYVFLADGFEEVEALCPVDLMRRAGIEVTTVSINKTTAVRGSHNILVHADTTAAALGNAGRTADGLECVLLPGGMPGTAHLDEDETVNSFLSAASLTGAYIAAICAAPSILGRRGLLEGREATCYPGFEDRLRGARLSDKRVVRDGNIITAVAMGASAEFALEIILALRGLDTANKVKESVFV
ncbi:MAG: DJ-1/PfpI family protein [Eubacteriales bacterium]|jgi:4-methyl-5(b-hydroxyethyl)-thiazole monophosphate biosynthesis|nr:DJ-1/PfpI family protein [Eubacteriales bacterium]